VISSWPIGGWRCQPVCSVSSGAVVGEPVLPKRVDEVGLAARDLGDAGEGGVPDGMASGSVACDLSSYQSSRPAISADSSANGFGVGDDLASC
jgi:hypothetical protein